GQLRTREHQRGETGHRLVKQSSAELEDGQKGGQKQDLIEKSDQDLRLIPEENNSTGDLPFKGEHLHKAGEKERIDRRIGQVRMRRFQERKIVGALLEFDLMLFNQMNAQWTDEFGGVAFACCDVAGQLGRVHRFRRGKISIFAQVVNGRQPQQ